MPNDTLHTPMVFVASAIGATIPLTAIRSIVFQPTTTASQIVIKRRHSGAVGELVFSYKGACYFNFNPPICDDRDGFHESAAGTLLVQ